MARIPDPGRMPPIYDTSVFRNVEVGPRLMYSFEQQLGVPVDGSNPLMRDMSPFNIRLIPPQNVLSNTRNFNTPSGIYVNSLGNLGQSTQPQSSEDNPLRRVLDRAQTRNASTRAFSSLPTANPSASLPQSFNASRSLIPASAYTALDIQTQTDNLNAIPPLTLLVNPNEMSVSYSNVQSYSQRGRSGLIFNRWGENMPAISFRGSTGAFIAGSSNLLRSPNTPSIRSETATPTGVQWASRRNSAAWQNFLALFHFYRSNAYVYDTFGGSEAHLYVGVVAIDFDQNTYLGHIDSFDYSFDESMPHRVEWSMEFTCFRTLDNSTGTNRSLFGAGSTDSFVSVVGRDSVPTVAPIASPTPSPSYPSRGMGLPSSGGTVGVTFRRDGVVVDPPEGFAQTPLNLLR
jgi:hypothetical protein